MEQVIIILAPVLITEIGRKRQGQVVKVSPTWWARNRHRLEKGGAITKQDYVKDVLSATDSRLGWWCRKRGLAVGGGRVQRVQRLLKGIAPVPDELPLQAGRGKKSQAQPKKKQPDPPPQDNETENDPVVSDAAATTTEPAQSKEATADADQGEPVAPTPQAPKKPVRRTKRRTTKRRKK